MAQSQPPQAARRIVGCAPALREADRWFAPER
jgi:hypothetical protein